MNDQLKDIDRTKVNETETLSKDRPVRAEYHREYYLKNRDKIRQQQKEYTQSPDFPDRSEYLREYRKTNKEKIKSQRDRYYQENRQELLRGQKEWQQANKEKYRESTQRWRKRNPGKMRAYGQNRRAREAVGTLSFNICETLYESQCGKCACCGKPLGKNYHLDHIQPLARGGKNEDNNVQLLRARCNSQKSSRCPIEFMQKERGKLL